MSYEECMGTGYDMYELSWMISIAVRSIDHAALAEHRKSVFTYCSSLLPAV